jgi:hypothetical protein
MPSSACAAVVYLPDQPMALPLAVLEVVLQLSCADVSESLIAGLYPVCVSEQNCVQHGAAPSLHLHLNTRLQTITYYMPCSYLNSSCATVLIRAC